MSGDGAEGENLASRAPPAGTMMSLFKKEAPPPPGGEVRAKGTYDLDIEADGDDPATAASVVAALYAKYKKNVRDTHPPDPDPARGASDVRARRRDAPVFSSPTVALEPPERGSNRPPLCPHHPLHPSPTLRAPLSRRKIARRITCR